MCYIIIFFEFSIGNFIFANLNLTWIHLYYFIFFIYFFYLFFLFIFFIYFLLKKLPDHFVSINFVRSNSFQLSSFILLTLLFFYILPVVFLIFLWKGPVVLLWFSHMFVNNFQLKFFCLSLVLFFIIFFLIFQIKYFSSQSSLDFLILLSFLLGWFYFLFGITNFYTLIFFFEILTVIAFSLLVSSFFLITDVTNKNVYFAYYTKLKYFFNSNFFSIILFFWISAITSIFLFLFISLYSYFVLVFDWNLIDLFSMFIFAYSNVYVKWFLIFFLLIFFLLVLFKCGLPPFLFWKSLFFINLNITFVAVYTLYFYYLLFSYFIYLFTFLTGILFTLLSHVLFFFFLFLLLYMILNLNHIYYTKLFVTFSSFINSILMFFFVFNVINLYEWFSVMYYILFYFFIYNLSMILFFNNWLNNSNVELTTLNQFVNLNMLYFKRFIFVYCIASIAGLPPFVLFFLKLTLLTNILTVGFAYTMLIIFGFLFISLVFYFQNIKFLLTPYKFNYVSNIVNKDELFLERFFSLNLILIVLLLFGVFFLNDLFITFFWLFV